MIQDYSTRLTSRFCHDIANPLGAIGNGLELLALSGLKAGPELSLIEDSVAQAAATLKRFRMAFGACDPAVEDRTEYTDQLLSVWNAASRVQMTAGPDVAISVQQQKLLCLLSLCAENTLPLGGLLDLQATPNGFKFSGTGRRIKWNGDLWAHVTAPAEATCDLAPAQLHFMTAGIFAAGMGAKVDANATDEDFHLSIMF